MQLTKEEYARKIILNGSSVQIENSVNQVTVQHHKSVTEFSISTSQPLKIPIFHLLLFI